ncbi:Kazal-type serine protease inhibitor domain protein [Minicystis rosea]|nr:Kazal-type serine protease inhibitor domain protein [Minicystis rosea]
MKTALPLVLGSFLFGILAAACSSSVETTNSGGGGNGTGGASTSSGTGGEIPVCTFEAPPCCADFPNDPCCKECQPTSKICGGILDAPCAPDEYCDFPDDLCGATDGQGICMPRPTACDKNLDPVCGCDGAVHDNACDAAAAGADVSLLGGCKAPQGTFACGSHFCTLGAHYCEYVISDVGGEPSTYTCQPLPASCNGVTTCACLADLPCGGPGCETTSDGGAQVSCGGG